MSYLLVVFCHRIVCVDADKSARYSFDSFSIFSTSPAVITYSVSSSNERTITQMIAPIKPTINSHQICQTRAKPIRKTKPEMYMPIAVFFGIVMSSYFTSIGLLFTVYCLLVLLSQNASLLVTVGITAKL